MTVTVYQGDCRDVLKTLPAESVQCCVTSPPYFGLRDYGTASWSGGDEECTHSRDRSIGVLSSTQGGGKGTTNHQKEASFRSVCGLCGAVRVDDQIGLEQTPREYVEQLVGVFREIRRVLRKEGTAWLNLGDSYAGSMKGYMGDGTWADRSQVKQGTNVGALNIAPTRASDIGLKNKDLIGIPWRVALALQEDGWYLRSDIIWSKPNVMPESVLDRPTKAHEYIFLLSRSQSYYYDADAIREDVAGYERRGGNATYTANGSATHGIGSTSLHQMSDAGRNKRSVWTVPTNPYAGAHFAVFPEALIEPCILAGSRVGDVVLDPFAGSGTTGRVATKHRRDAVLIELNPDYCELIEKRTSRVQQTLPMEDAS